MVEEEAFVRTRVRTLQRVMKMKLKVSMDARLGSERRSDFQAVGVKRNSRGLQWSRMDQMNVDVVEWGCDVSKRTKGVGIQER